ncbi:hypothetical protein [Hyphomonas sp.]|uniref:cobaltochelatase CobT-related protein n=1 Tax=Hyphomonas sp. TaxID=87 RepID=UPI000C408031|nr:hypothetical protein [Hyphomonas sp.]MBM58098.1 cobalamin biosynthesis protein CobT [Hyphomonas sp.]
MPVHRWLCGLFRKIFPARQPPPERPYTIYTTEFDQTVSYLDLAGSYDLDERFSESDFEAQKVAYEEASRGASEPLGLCEPSIPAADLAVTILVDHSGSMAGENAIIARKIVELLDSTFLSWGIDHEVLGFTTSSWRGGRSAEKWRTLSNWPYCGRLCDLLHIVYRDFSDRTLLANRMEPILDGRLLKENIDGEALEWARSRLQSHGKQQNRIILVSDGAPVDDMTLYTNEGDILVRHLLKTVDEISLRAGWKIGGIGVGYDCREYYASSVWFGDLPIDTCELRQFLCKLLSVPANSVTDEA